MKVAKLVLLAAMAGRFNSALPTRHTTRTKTTTNTAAALDNLINVQSVVPLNIDTDPSVWGQWKDINLQQSSTAVKTLLNKNSSFFSSSSGGLNANSDPFIPSSDYLKIAKSPAISPAEQIFSSPFHGLLSPSPSAPSTGTVKRRSSNLHITSPKKSWMAALFNPLNSQYLCGGVMIEPNLVLTTAFCVWLFQSNPASFIRKVFTEHEVQMFSEHHHRSLDHQITHLFKHPGFDGNDPLRKFNIGLLFLKPHYHAATLNDDSNNINIVNPVPRSELFIKLVDPVYNIFSSKQEDQQEHLSTGSTQLVVNDDESLYHLMALTPSGIYTRHQATRLSPVACQSAISSAFSHLTNPQLSFSSSSHHFCLQSTEFAMEGSAVYKTYGGYSFLYGLINWILPAGGGGGTDGHDGKGSWPILVCTDVVPLSRDLANIIPKQ